MVRGPKGIPPRSRGGERTMTHPRRNRAHRNAFLDRKSWKGYGSRKGFAKRRVAKADRRVGKAICRDARDNG